ncbi:hypothetical protein CB1_000875042 [Camelus ferus]|nr:hypothetical protein CB1_000875042 [Camelus ferus]
MDIRLLCGFCKRSSELREDDTIQHPLECLCSLACFKASSQVGAEKRKQQSSSTRGNYFGGNTNQIFLVDFSNAQPVNTPSVVQSSARASVSKLPLGLTLKRFLLQTICMIVTGTAVLSNPSSGSSVQGWGPDPDCTTGEPSGEIENYN